APQKLLQSKPGEVVRVRWVSYEKAKTRVSTWTYLGELSVFIPGGRTVRGKAIRRGTGHSATLAMYDYSNELIYTRYSDGFVLVRVAEIPVPFTPESLNIPSVLDTNLKIQNADDIKSMELELHVATSRESARAALLEDSAYQDVIKT